jgi:hypothetical protein
VLLAACSAARTSPVPEPEVAIEQTSAVPRQLFGPMTLRYLVQVRNVAKEPLTLKRIDLNTIGVGAYNVGPLSRPYNVTIEPGRSATVEIVGTGNVAMSTVSGANGPVTLHLVLLFESSLGSFQTVVNQPVRSSSAPD